MSDGRRATLAAVCVVALAATTARADDAPVTVRYVTRVPVGQVPRVEFQAQQSIGRLTVQLSRDDGKSFVKSCATMAPGETCTIELGGEPGTHTYEGVIELEHGGSKAPENRIRFEAVVMSTLSVTVDKASVDLKARTLTLSANRPIANVELTLRGDGGRVLGQVDVKPEATANGSLRVSWPAVAGEPARIDLKATDANGFFAGVSLLPWSVYIPHEEVTFATDKAEIAPAERPKLDASLRKIAAALKAHREIGPVTLFVAGHTDTQGAAAYNVELSRKRARAIAAYFRARGLKIPIAYEGFGEHALAVGTSDETDEPRNRRVDYILGVEEPQLRPRGFAAQWKRLP